MKMMKMKSMWGSCRDFSGGDGTHPVEPERLNLKKKISMDISSKKTLWKLYDIVFISFDF